MITTYDFIDSNRRKTIFLVCLFPITLIFMLYFSFFVIHVITQLHFTIPIKLASAHIDITSSLFATLKEVHNSVYPLIPIIFIVSIVWTIIAFYFGQNFIMSFADARPADTVQDSEIIRLVENIAITAGLPMPQVHIMDDDNLNAFATGMDPQNAHIVLTTGIIECLTKSELEGVIAHEMAHINNRDTRIMMIIILLIGFFTFAGSFIVRIGFSTGGRRRRRNSDNGLNFLIILGIILYIYGIIVAPLIRLAISRRREYQADAKAALITRNPQGLISALKKISGNSEIESFQQKGKEILSPMCIANPLEEESSLFTFLSNITSTHPPIGKRIAALEVMDGTEANY